MGQQEHGQVLALSPCS